MPIVNDLATALTSFKYSNASFLTGINMYPGQDWCKLKSPHALWHHQTAIALVDLVLLADQMDIIFIKYRPQLKQHRRQH